MITNGEILILNGHEKKKGIGQMGKFCMWKYVNHGKFMDL